MSSSIRVDMSNVRQFGKYMREVRDIDSPRIQASVVNVLAFGTRTMAIRHVIPRLHTVRNRFTTTSPKGGVFVERAVVSRTSSMISSRVGSRSQGMRDLEFGKTEVDERVPVMGEARQGNNRKVILQSKRLRENKEIKDLREIPVDKGNRDIGALNYLRLRKWKGFIRIPSENMIGVKGGVYRFKPLSKYRERTGLRMIWDNSIKSFQTPRTQWLKKSTIGYLDSGGAKLAIFRAMQANMREFK